MQTIGLIGGMSWESSAEYYKIINEEVRAKQGGLHSAKSLMYSVDFHEIDELQHMQDWEKLNGIMIDAGLRLECGGADIIVICTNTMHKCVPAMEKKISIPILHIADATGKAMEEKGIKKVGLLGTRFTMEQDFLKGKLEKEYGVEVLIPEEEGRAEVHRVIYQELCMGQILESSRQAYIEIIKDLISQGAEGVILGCTEIPLLIKQEDVSIPVFDTTTIHAKAAVHAVVHSSH